MGWNTTVVVMNDALEDIARDPDFGQKLKMACLRAVAKSKCPVDVSAMGYINAATVIETHHADYNVLVCVGGNTGEVIESEYMGIPEVAATLGVSMQTVRNHIVGRTLPAWKVSGRWVVRKSDFEQYQKRVASGDIPDKRRVKKANV
jgi:excisionase family DNA binding protein